mmetsp:Transcript_5957/g.12872  ORF Transcript_5957/g.12872 Transcript_5957/m.12872 type:complete len:139 (-) Transcript_5957:116-532(-)
MPVSFCEYTVLTLQPHTQTHVLSSLHKWTFPNYCEGVSDSNTLLLPTLASVPIQSCALHALLFAQEIEVTEREDVSKAGKRATPLFLISSTPAQLGPPRTSLLVAPTDFLAPFLSIFELRRGRGGSSPALSCMGALLL